MPEAAADFRGSGWSAGRERRSAAVSWSPRCTRTGTAAMRSSRGASDFMNRIAARAASSIERTLASVSRASAASTTGKAAGSRDLKTAWAALILTCGFGSRSVSEPSVASRPRRTRLLRRTGLSACASAVAVSPVLASRSAPASSRNRMAPSGERTNRRPAARAASTGWAVAWPVWARLSIPASVSSKRSAEKRFSASSTASARADPSAAQAKRAQRIAIRAA